MNPSSSPNGSWHDSRSSPRSYDPEPRSAAAHYAALLDAAHQQLGGPIVLVWNNLSTHTSKAMAELIAARPWLTVYRLPPYGHELNPVEVIWSHLKRSLANLTRHTIAELTALVEDPPETDPVSPRPAGQLPRQYGAVVRTDSVTPALNDR
ncbi:transposase [Geodermatophilus sp. URMC 65]